jgi:hypothetical protein
MNGVIKRPIIRKTENINIVSNDVLKQVEKDVSIVLDFVNI